MSIIKEILIRVHPTNTGYGANAWGDIELTITKSGTDAEYEVKYITGSKGLYRVVLPNCKCASDMSLYTTTARNIIHNNIPYKEENIPTMLKDDIDHIKECHCTFNIDGILNIKYNTVEQTYVHQIYLSQIRVGAVCAKKNGRVIVYDFVTIGGVRCHPLGYISFAVV